MRALPLLLVLAAVPPAATAQTATPANRRLTWDAATRTATFALDAGAPGSSGPFNFDGYAGGAATLRLPAGATVVMNFRNLDGVPHSAEVIGGAGPLPNMGGTPAIPGAYTTNLLNGLPQGGTDVIRFTAPASGAFRIFCGVPGHGLSGMWIGMTIGPSGSTPSFSTQ